MIEEDNGWGSGSTHSEGESEEGSFASLSPVPIVSPGPSTERTSPVPSTHHTPSPPPAYTRPVPDERTELTLRFLECQQRFVEVSLFCLQERGRMRDDLQEFRTRERDLVTMLDAARHIIRDLTARGEELERMLEEAQEREEMEYVAQVAEDTNIPAGPYGNAGSVLDPVYIARLILKAIQVSIWVSVALVLVMPAMRPLLPRVLAAAFVVLVVFWLLQAFADNGMPQAY